MNTFQSTLRFRIPIFAFFAFFCLCQWYVSRPGLTEELLIIVPYKADSTVGIQTDASWVDIGNLLADYKTRTGISAEVMTLDYIIGTFEGVDEPEKVKMAIHHRAITASTEYVMLVGDGGVFPVRYRMRGYTTNGETVFGNSGNLANAYQFLPCDAYYANLWSNDDPQKTFDNWNADGDTFFGEMYRNNVRGVDDYTIHPDVAVGRVPAETPEEFLNYALKVIVYENRLQSSGRDRTGLFVSGDSLSCLTTKYAIGDQLGPTWAINYLIRDSEDDYHEELSDGTSASVAVPGTRMSELIQTYTPQFINYAGHGWMTSLSEVGFDTTRAIGLSLRNPEAPAIVFAAACHTGRYVEMYADPNPPVVAVTSGANITSMAEAFLTKSHTGGGVIYVGSVQATQSGGRDLDRHFFTAVSNGISRAGDAWNAAIEAFIAQHNFDTFTESEYIDIEDEADPNHPGKWDWVAVDRFQHISKVHFFGDPSLRIHGVTNEDTAPPITTATMEDWITAEDLAASLASPPYYHPVQLTATDAGTGVSTIHFKYRVLDTFSVQSIYNNVANFDDACDFQIPIELSADMEGHESEVRYRSVDLLGNTEAWQTRMIRYDFTPPVSQLVVDGDSVPAGAGGEIYLDNVSFSLSATDNVSGVCYIEYAFGNGTSWTRVQDSSVEFGSPNPCSPLTYYTLHYRAVDCAGNIEEERSVTIHQTSISRISEFMCHKDWLREINKFPHMQREKVVDLRFWEDVARIKPQRVRFDFSGPVTQDYMEHRWNELGNAAYNKATKSWDLPWDTQESGVQSGWYWMRSVATADAKATVTSEPFLLLINNIDPSDYTLALSTDADSVTPGQGSVVLHAQLGADGLDRLRNLEMRLIGDRSLWMEKGEENFTASLRSLDPERLWEMDFPLTPSEKMSGLREIRLQVGVEADGVAQLLSSELILPVIPPRTTVRGRVLDQLGKPISATVRLSVSRVSLVAETGPRGEYQFSNVAPGDCTLELDPIPETYRQIVPRGSAYRFQTEGKEVTRDFVLVAADSVAPVVTQELSWAQMTKAGCLYGITHDRTWGTGVDRVAVAIGRQGSREWMTARGTPSDTVTWFPVEDLFPVEAFLRNQLDSVLADLPEEARNAQRDKLEALWKGLGEGVELLVWTYPLKDPTIVSKWDIFQITAEDHAGNEATTNTALSCPRSVEIIGPEHVALEEGTVKFGASVDDPDNSDLLLRWSCEPDEGVTLSLPDKTGERALLTFEKEGKYTITLYVSDGDCEIQAEKVVEVSSGGVRTIIGDVDNNRKLELTDALVLLEFLFRGKTEPVTACLVNASVDADDEIDITDAVYLLLFLFERGSAPVNPDTGEPVDRPGECQAYSSIPAALCVRPACRQ